MSALETYIGTKIIQAVLAQHVDGRPGYQVVYEDGYTSWSPKDVFERAYRKTDAMSFGDALVMLEAGKKVARAGWNGNRLSTGFVPPNREPVIYNGLGHILLASGEIAIFDPEDFDIVSRQPNWCLMGNGYPSFTEYAEGGGGEDRKTVKLHSLILPDATYVDHINGDKLDNRRRNLRPCDTSENNANRGSIPGSSSQYKGVTWDKSRTKWMATIAAHGKSKTIGCFYSEIDAARAYDLAAKSAYGDFARLNFPEPRMWLALSCGETKDVPADRFWSEHNRAHAEANGGTARVLPSITMKTATGEILMGWLASQTDMQAKDWQVVE